MILIVQSRVVVSAAASLLFVAACSGPVDAAAATVDYSLPPESSKDSPRDAYERADACLAEYSRKFSNLDEPSEVLVEAMLGACSDALNHAQATTRIQMATAKITTAPPEGFFLDVPPCKDGTATCKPWNRAWSASGEELARGTVLGSSDQNDLRNASDEASRRIFQDLRRRAYFWVVVAKTSK